MGSKPGQKFGVEDTCRLKSDPALLGHVCRTHYDVESQEHLHDLLIRSYTSVSEQDLMEFLETGVPPKGYVFVSFLEPSQGSSLIHEDDLELVDRALELGETVKRHLDDTMSGTIVSTSAKCCLEPIAFRNRDPNTGEYGSLKFADKPRPRVCSVYPEPDDGETPRLYNVPISELTSYEEFSEGDYIIYRQKLGYIHAVDRDAVLLLPNQKVVIPHEPAQLEVPLCSDSSKVVSLPDHFDAINTHRLKNGEFMWSTTEADFVFPGQFVFTPSKNLDRKDITLGNGEQFVPEGYVLATPPENVHVDWVCPNVFAPGMPYTSDDSETLLASDLIGNAVKCDFGNLPGQGSRVPQVKSDTWLRAGDKVRFRDARAAATTHATSQHIPPDQSFGYDLNILRIVSTETEVTVQWQDGTTTTEKGVNLNRFLGPEDEVWPGNIVALKDATERVQRPYHQSDNPRLTTASAEFWDTVLVKKIGVVQAVDSRERIASVRWFNGPGVELLSQGNILRPGSSLGELGRDSTHVSLYELTTYPGLSRLISDTVLIVPETVHQSTFPGPQEESIEATGPCTLSFLAPVTLFKAFVYLESMKNAIVKSEWFRNTTRIDTAPLPGQYTMHYDELGVKGPTDFVGKIISMDLDGTITVRLAGVDNCRDIRVPFEKIMMIIDEEDTVPPGAPPPGLPLDMDDPWITETYEYEGGVRLDDGSGDDDWMTEDGYEEIDWEETPNVAHETGGGGVDRNENFTTPGVSEIAPPDHDDEHTNEEAVLPAATEQPTQRENGAHDPSGSAPSSCPPSFALLEGSPPSDHRFISQAAPSAFSKCLKRIRKEFGILSSSLPPGIFVRTWESRIDLLRVLIIGPQGTPYEHAPFVIDFHFSDDFPTQPPAAFFHSWTNGQGMINPNLYEDGKVCLSVLGTWPTENPEETWSPVNSTVLQILVSIMGLVLVKTPFYNEPGYESLAAENDRRVESSQYTEKAFLLTRRFIQHALEHPVAGLEDIIAWNYLADAEHQESEHPRLLRRAIKEALDMIEHHNSTSTEDASDATLAASPFVSRLSLGAVVMLRKHVTALEKIEATATARSRP
ncbi:ubiquitin-conjugating enzyme E2 [Aspergillus candidus]|uniref:Ubiquitin-conjugating enzyme n=1 Tax=Aspergillus candidus TaxID=41067 RepID=A0A2I2FCZ7_ASPCN|nr:ubiquitin-conjugating enzyme [Aspergillus candidus]PLB38474.1 ubiquitin-conjugating enzyme [Aspergillus candidus]